MLTGINAGDRSGTSVSAAGDVNGDGIDDVIIGANHADYVGLPDAGESYVVFGSTQGSPAVLPLSSLTPAGGGDGSAGFVLVGKQAFQRSGDVVSAAGDVNGDGIDDLIVCNSETGSAYVVFRSTQRFPAVFPLASLYPDDGGDGSAGFVITGVHAIINGHIDRASAAGDVNGDGIDDVILGAPLAAVGQDVPAGQSWVVFGSGQGFPAVLPLASLYPASGGDGSAGFVLTGIDENDRTGQSVSAAGDINGDGVDDLVIGAYLADTGAGRYDSGAAFAVFGSTQGFPAVLPLGSLLPAGGGDGSAGFVLPGAAEDDHAGWSVSAAGDVNADGIDDIIIGANAADTHGERNAGESYLVFGSTQGFPATLPLDSLLPENGGDGSVGVVLSGIDAYDASGRSVSDAGDVNGDGIDDVVVGADGADRGREVFAGESYVLFGRSAAR